MRLPTHAQYADAVTSADAVTPKIHRIARRSILVLGAVAAVGTVITALIVGPGWLVHWSRPATPLSPGEHATAIASARLAILYTLGGSLAVVGLVYSHLRHRREELQFANDRLRVANERYAQGAEQLASADQSIQIAGIYGLASLAEDAPRLRTAIADVLRRRLRVILPPVGKGGSTSTHHTAEVLFEVLTRPAFGSTVDIEQRDLSGLNLRFGEGFVTVSECVLDDTSIRGLGSLQIFNSTVRDTQLSATRFVAEACEFRSGNILWGPGDVTREVNIAHCRLEGLDIAAAGASRPMRFTNCATGESWVDGVVDVVGPQRIEYPLQANPPKVAEVDRIVAYAATLRPDPS